MGGATASDDVAVAVVPVPSVSGRVTFDYVPVKRLRRSAGLDYNATEARPVRGVTVQVVQGDEVIDTAVTGEDGAYTINAVRNSEVLVRVRAEIAESESSWDARVLDNTQGDALYAMDSAPFSTGEADIFRDLHAASGWTGSAYGVDRVAAPFAILDVVYDAMLLIQSAEAGLNFPPLKLFWSPNNVTLPGEYGIPDIDSGQLGGTFFRRDPDNPDSGIYLLGEENQNTDEYDRSVIAHEWAHYLADYVSRSDSTGGSHGLVFQLDMRVAFSEGSANALAAMITGESIRTSSFGPRQGYGGSFSVENFGAPRPRGWFNEVSVQEILYDLFDPVNDDELELGYGRLHPVLIDDLRETPALTSIFPFIHALKTDLPGQAAAIDALVALHGIEPIIDAFGSTETNSGYPPNPDVLPIYSILTVNGGPVNVCSTADFRRGMGGGHALGSSQYFKFNASSTGNYTVSATATSVPQGERPDPAFAVYRRGFAAASQRPPSAECTPENIANCIERVSAPLPAGAGDYVLEVVEWTNVDRHPDNRPIGRTCFDVEVTSP